MKARSFFESDTSLILQSGFGNADARYVRDEVVRMLSAIGWRVQIDPRVKRDYPSIAKNFHHGQKGELQVLIECSSSSLKLEFFQDVVHENRYGGRYDFSKREKMPYLIGLQYEATVRRIDRLAKSLNLMDIERDRRLTGMQLIEKKRAKLMAFHGHDFYAKDNYPSYNCTSADGQQLRDGDYVWLRSDYGDTAGRWLHGRAYRNINDMWWVMLPGGDVENEGATFLRTSKPAILQGRQFSTARMLKRLNAEKQKAVSAEDYERAAKLRDVIKVVSQDGGER